MSVRSLIPLEPRARWAVLLLVVVIAADVVAVGVDIWEIALVERYKDGRDIGAGALATSHDRQSVMGAIRFVLLIVAALVFVRWFSAAYRNLAALGKAETRFEPGWAIGAWFVPILNLWRPKQIANEMWLESGVAGSGPRPGDSTVLLTRWWILWLAGGIIGNLTARLLFTADTLDDISNSDAIDVASLALRIAAAVLAIAVIQRMTERQVTRARRVGGAAT